MEEKFTKFLSENKKLQKSQQRLKSDRLDLSTIKLNKTALSSNNDKKI